jgi:hypothetical protein
MNDNPNLTITKEKYDIAGLKIIMTTYYKETMKRSIPYRSEEDWPDEMADGVIDFGQEFYEKVYKERMPYSNYTMIEYMYTGSLFHRFLLNHNGCMLHSSAVVVDGYAYLFSANSGTGKSTHTGLWLEHFKDKAFIINDDKPTLKYENGNWYVYGTPWCGKHNINVNTKVRLGAIVFLERSEKNQIEPLEVKEAIPLFFNQTIRMLKTEEKMDLALKVMENVLTQNPIYKMGCNISDEAVITAYEKIRRV